MAWTRRRRSAARTASSGCASGSWSAWQPRRGVALRDLSFAELDLLWDQAKAELAAAAPEVHPQAAAAKTAAATGTTGGAAGDGAAQEAEPASTGGEATP